MAVPSLLALIDDIATLLDDVAVLTKVATQKTAGLLGDDLALNAEQVSGIKADRELPVIWAVAKGSLLNKAILIPAALGISAVAPWAITPLLMMGGGYLCFEGAEKLAHRWLPADEAAGARRTEHLQALASDTADLVAFEKAKIKGAIRTDFVLSAEIIAITLGTVQEQPLSKQFAVLSVIGLMLTVVCYGLVAAIVKLDDAGLALCRVEYPGKPGSVCRSLGRAILVSAPYLMRGLALAGTVAMFLVGGSILTHGIPPLHHWLQNLTLPGPLSSLLLPTLSGVFGVTAGLVLLVITKVGARVRAGAAQDKP